MSIFIKIDIFFIDWYLLEKQNWVHVDNRNEIFDFLGKSDIKFSRIKKYRKVLEKAEKDISQYQEL